MTDQEVGRRRGEIFFLWMSVLNVILGCALTSHFSSDSNDIWFIIGIINGLIGSILAFGLVLYISFSSEYHYQETVSTARDGVPQEIEHKPEQQEYQENATTVPHEYQENGKKESITTEKESMSDKFPKDESKDYSTNDLKFQLSGKTNLELEKLQQIEYEEVQDILNKANKMLQDFKLIASSLETQRKQFISDNSSH